MKKTLSLLLALAMILSMIPFAAFAEDGASGTTVYLEPNSNWLVDSARFAVYYWDDSTNAWADMSDADGDGIYEGVVPAGYSNIIFCRMNPSTTENNWDNRWNQTSDLTIPTDGTNCYTVAEGAWDKGDGTWSTYTAEEEETECVHVAGDVADNYDGETHSYTCTLCGETVTEAHSYGENGECVCGAVKLGTENNPISITPMQLDANGNYTVTVPAGETVYYVVYQAWGMDVAVNGVYNGSVTAMSYSFSITNDGEADADYVINLSYPVGSQNNPAELSLGYNTVYTEAGGSEYYYTWTATANGTLTISVEAYSTGWTYVVNNMTTYAYGDTHWSDDEPVVSSETVTVSEGDEIIVMASTYDPASPYSAPEGYVYVIASFACAEHGETEITDNYDGETHSSVCSVCGSVVSEEAHSYDENGECVCGAVKPGTENNPISITPMQLDANGNYTVTVPAGETVYYVVYQAWGMDVAINGVYNGSVTAMSYSFSITNDGEADADYVINLSSPAGTQNNPDELVLGENTVTFEAGDSEYYYTWTATANGTLTISVEATTGWSYAVDNMTTYAYGDTHWSDDDPVVSSEILTVSEGDEIIVKASTYDPASPWSAPAGTVTVTAEFEEAEDISTTDGDATASSDSKYTIPFSSSVSGTLYVTVGNGTTNWCADIYSFATWGAVASLTGSEEATFSAQIDAGTSYYIRLYGVDANGDGKSDALAATPYSYYFVADEESDKTEIEIPENAETIASGTDVVIETNGYDALPKSVTWTPDSNGYLYVHMISSSSGSWYYTIAGLTLGINGQDETMDQYIVSAGTEYVINICCYDSILYSTCDGTISYALYFVADEDAAVETEKEAYTISDQVITGEGSWDVTMLNDVADITIVSLTPDETGYYTISVDGTVAQIANLGGGSWYIYDWDSEGHEAGSTIENWLCEEVAGEYEDAGETYVSAGQSMMLGIKSENETVTVTVEKTADYVVDDVELQTYVNKAELSQFTLPEGAVVGEYVDVYGETHTAVKDAAGYYHLDSIDGPALMVDLNYLTVLSDALRGGRGVMYAYITDENGKTIEKWDIGNAFLEYEDAADENGYYPLTDDLIFFYDTYAEGNGVYPYVLEEGYNEECAWMFACLTVEAPAPEAPEVKSSNITSTGKIQLSWNAVEGAVKYVISVCDAEGKLVKTVYTSGTTLKHSSAVAGAAYTYTVKAIGCLGDISEGDSTTRCCDLAQPEVTTTNVAPTGKIKISWNAVSGADSYQLIIYANGKKINTVTTTKTSISHSSAEAGVTYTYKVRALMDGVTAASSAYGSSTRCCDLARPEVTTANILSSGKIKISWKAVSGADSYQVVIYANGKKINTVTTTKTSINHTSAEAGVTYTYKVRALMDGVTAASSAYDSSTRCCDLARPAVSVSLNSKGKPALKWKAVSGADKYVVYIYDANGNLIKSTTTTKTAINHNSATAGVTYTYKVRAVMSDVSAATSAYSVAKSITSK